MTKQLGIVGGIGPETTILYYRYISDFFRSSGHKQPNIFINSIDASEMLSYVESGDLEGLCKLMVHQLERLSRSGVDFAIMASNTPHIVFDEVQASSPIPLISIVSVTVERASQLGLRKPCILGTKSTMVGDFYPYEFSKKGIEIALPPSNKVELFHDRYMNELMCGVYKETTKREFMDEINAIKDNFNIDSIILGGTELSFLLKDEDFDEITVLDSTYIHLNEIVEVLKSE